MSVNSMSNLEMSVVLRLDAQGLRELDRELFQWKTQYQEDSNTDDLELLGKYVEENFQTGVESRRASVAGRKCIHIAYNRLLELRGGHFRVPDPMIFRTVRSIMGTCPADQYLSLLEMYGPEHLAYRAARMEQAFREELEERERRREARGAVQLAPLERPRQRRGSQQNVSWAEAALEEFGAESESDLWT